MPMSAESRALIDTCKIVWYNETMVNIAMLYIIQVTGGPEMRKFINVLIVAAMVLSLCACSDSANGKVDSSKDSSNASSSKNNSASKEISSNNSEAVDSGEGESSIALSSSDFSSNFLSSIFSGSSNMSGSSASSSKATSSKPSSSKVTSSKVISSKVTSSNSGISAVRASKVGEEETIYNNKMVMTFYDDFTGTSLNRSKWDYCPEWTRADRGGKWDDSQAKVEDGNLVLSVSYDENEGCCKSGAVRTLNRFSQTKGYFECSMKVQDVPGFWSAFWLMSPTQSKVGNGAVDGVELDIMEAYNYTKKGLNFALHWDGYGADHKSAGKDVIRRDIYDGEFHTFALLWSDTAYIFYVDGVETWRTTSGGICNAPAYMKLTLEVGSWAGEINKSKLPANVYVDYVRAYQFKDKV